MSHTTRSGVAVVAAVTPPAEADALTGCHWDWSNQRNVVRLTSWSRPGGGLMPNRGGGIGVYPSACCARANGLTGAACGTHTTMPVELPVLSTQICRYQAPAPVPFGGPQPCAAMSFDIADSVGPSAW